MKRIYISVLIVSTIVILDRASKHLVKTLMSPFESIEVLPVLNIVNVRNTGAAFGMFKWLGNYFFIGISSLAIVLIVFLILKDKRNHTGFTLILAGAIGNLADRLLYGQVIDFIDFFIGNYHWPAFNVADSAITMGIALIFINSISEHIKLRQQGAA